MKLQTKTLWALLPTISVALVGLGLWSAENASENVQETVEQYLTGILDTYISQNVQARYDLLKESRLDVVPSFVKSYQSDAMQQAGKIKMLWHGHIHIFDHGGASLYQPKHLDDQMNIREWANAISLTREAENGRHFGTIETEFDHAFFVAQTFDPWKWVVFIVIDGKVITSASRGIVFGTLAVTIGASLLIVLSVWAASRKVLLRPISHLRQAALEIAANRDVANIPIQSNDELGDLAREIEAMSSRIMDGRQKLLRWNEELEAQVRQRTEDLERSNAEVRRFAYIVSHDLRSPLVNLKGFVGELNYVLGDIGPIIEAHAADLDEKKRDQINRAFREDVPEALHFIGSSVTRMDLLIEAVLELSRLGRRDLTPETLDLDTIVNEILNTLSHQITERNITVRHDKLPIVYADRLATEQIFANILSNSIKFMDPHRDQEIDINVERDASHFVFHIRDSGRGISESNIEKIFEPFRRVGNQDVPGEGMGLAYVQTIVRRHGGQIWCRSKLNEETTVSFSLPASKTAFDGDIS